MSKADEMFEKLGYKKLNEKELKSSFDDDFLELLLCAYEAPMYNFVYFYNDKTVQFNSSKNMQGLQAINEKCKELRMDGGIEYGRHKSRRVCEN